MTTDPSSDVERLSKRVELHRAGEAISGHRVAHVDVSVADVEALLATIERLSAELERAREAVTPSGSTKAAYHGEFTFETEDGVSDAGIERYRKVYVPWTTVKEIMAAIRNRAALSNTAENG